MIRAPNAMRRGLATLPVSLGNSLAYFTSNSSHGIRSASLTQRLSGFMWSPIGWLKSRNECCNLSIGLYIVLAPLYLKSVRKLQEKRFVFVKILAIIIPENGAKVSKIKCFQFAQQTLIYSMLLYLQSLLHHDVIEVLMPAHVAISPLQTIFSLPLLYLLH